MCQFIVLQHPQIQKKSQYIKYLCCDDVRTLHQWVNGIRIAKVISLVFFFRLYNRNTFILHEARGLGVQHIVYIWLLSLGLLYYQ